MTDTAQLVSAVLILTYKYPIHRPEPHLGRAAQAIALSYIQQIDPALSERLHDYDGMMPYTVSDLFQSDREHHWLRITGLRADVCRTLHTLAQSEGLSVDDWTIRMGLTQLHDWAKTTSVEQLVRDHWQATSELEIHFETPASVKSRGVYCALPQPELIFKSLYGRWQRLMTYDLPYAPPPAVLEAFLTYGVGVDSYQVQSHKLQMKRSLIPSFSGRVTYRVLAPTRQIRRKANESEIIADALAHYDDLRSLLNLLTAFGFYSGVGIKTAQGMGMMRPAGWVTGGRD